MLPRREDPVLPHASAGIFQKRQPRTIEGTIRKSTRSNQEIAKIDSGL